MYMALPRDKSRGVSSSLYGRAKAGISDQTETGTNSSIFRETR